MSEQNIQIVIINDKGAGKCDASCGVDWSSAEVMALADQQVKARFGDRVQLEYLDLSQPVTHHHVLEWQQRTRNGNLPLPLLIINGELRISGQFDMRLLLDAVDADIEIHRRGGDGDAEKQGR
ncbi:hypothetical protein ACFLUZ_01190 [Chloroflexota bacterium]